MGGRAEEEEEEGWVRGGQGSGQEGDGRDTPADARLWMVSAEASANALPQPGSSHTNGRSCVCTRMCCVAGAGGGRRWEVSAERERERERGDQRKGRREKVRVLCGTRRGTYLGEREGLGERLAAELARVGPVACQVPESTSSVSNNDLDRKRRRRPLRFETQQRRKKREPKAHPCASANASSPSASA